MCVMYGFFVNAWSESKKTLMQVGISCSSMDFMAEDCTLVAVASRTRAYFLVTTHHLVLFIVNCDVCYLLSVPSVL